MIPKQLNEYAALLQRTNFKSFYLSFLRVTIGLWLLKEVAINWSSLDLLYGHSGFNIPKNNVINRLPDGFNLVKDYYRLFIYTYLVVIILTILGIGKWISALLLFCMLYLMQRMNMSVVDGGDKMVRLLLFYLIFADSYQYFTISKRESPYSTQKIKNLLSNLSSASMMLQLCLVYFAAALSKIDSPHWMQGEAFYYTLLNDRFMGTPLNSWLATHKWLDYLINYGTMLFELLFPFLIWFKKLRPYLIITGILFHLSIYVFMMIYGFQIIFILIYGFFLPNAQLLKYAHKIKKIFGSKQSTFTRYVGLEDSSIQVKKL